MIKLLSGDCRDVLSTLPAESVQCAATSPPYYGLRDYGTALWDGGDAGCDHKPRPRTTTEQLHDTDTSGFRGGDHGTLGAPFRDTCGKCGAVRVDRQIGLEATPDEYLATMVGVFREVRRVLRPDGTCWVNMGDSYAGSPAGNFGTNRPEAGVFNNYRSNTALNTTKHAKPKDLLRMPARLALALQADGWWVRSDIIWHKPNPMPESVTDRCVSAHEHVFMLTKASRYYFDADAIRQEPSGSLNPIRSFGSCPDRQDNGRSYPLDGLKGAACRNVWTIATHAYPDAHFATFPPELAERCIKAGTSERGCCAACGKPWVRQTEVSYTNAGNGNNNMKRKGGDYEAAMSSRPYEVRKLKDVKTAGWAPGCQCDADTVPCTVLDPFIGAGTTALVADRLQRDCIGIDLNTQYTRMAMDRCIADAPLFTSFPPAEPPEDERQKELFLEPEYGA